MPGRAVLTSDRCLHPPSLIRRGAGLDSLPVDRCIGSPTPLLTKVYGDSYEIATDVPHSVGTFGWMLSEVWLDSVCRSAWSGLGYLWPISRCRYSGRRRGSRVVGSMNLRHALRHHVAMMLAYYAGAHSADLSATPAVETMLRTIEGRYALHNTSCS